VTQPVDYQAAIEFIQSRTAHRPAIGIILGSGMADFASAIQEVQTLETADIPGWPRSTVEGHHGRLLFGQLEGKLILALQGRVHFYEGYTPQQVVFPIRVMAKLGIKTLIVTNAAGGLNRNFEMGDLMLIQDHINMVGLAGHNPLIGPNDPSFGVRFPDMTNPYDSKLRALARQIATREGLVLREGVYVCVAGPSYETPAEVRMLRMLGGDAVGMSTAPEVVVARHSGMHVMGISGISNICHDTNDPSLQTTHTEVMEIGTKRIIPALNTLIRGVLREMS
jgi:purine-nucleoside phosphorylase